MDFSNFKEGDKVGCDNPPTERWGSHSYEVGIIRRWTPTRWIVEINEKERRFRKTDGKEIGGKGTLIPVEEVLAIRNREKEAAVRHDAECAANYLHCTFSEDFQADLLNLLAKHQK